MHVEARTEHPMTEDAIRAATGRGWNNWYALLDAQGGPGQGRRALGEYLLKEHKVDAWWLTTLLVEYERTRGVKEKDGRPTGYNICVTKTIGASADRVYAAFAHADALGAWFGTPTELEFREGGRFATTEGARGEFRRLAPGKTLRFSWDVADPSLASQVEVKLAPKGDKCGVVLNHERIQTRELADGLRAGWGGALDRLKQSLER